jgi:hypothetical protein
LEDFDYISSLSLAVACLREDLTALGLDPKN